MTYEKLINEASQAFETKKRDNGQEFTCLKDDAPQWLKDSISDIHGVDLMPNDWRYSKIEHIFSAFGQYDFDRMSDDDYLSDIIPEVADGLCDIYYSDLAAWVTGSTFHDVESAMEERQGLEADLSKCIQLAQYRVIETMTYAAINAINEELES